MLGVTAEDLQEIGLRHPLHCKEQRLLCITGVL